MLNRYFILLGFKGTNYHGWQKQPGSVTVQEVLDQKLSLLLHEPIQTIGAGRTDTGVHATSFYAHFDTHRNDLHHQTKFIYQLNCILPWDIAIYDIISMPAEAHARFDAISRTYLYRVATVKDPFSLDFATYISKILNVENMNVAASILHEYTDFTSFSKLHSDAKTNNCQIFHAAWTKHGNELHFHISANRFLRNMVRAIVGTLLEVGQGKLLPQDIRRIIEMKNRSMAGISVDAKGLHLIQIDYPDNYFSRH